MDENVFFNEREKLIQNEIEGADTFFVSKYLDYLTHVFQGMDYGFNAVEGWFYYGDIILVERELGWSINPYFNNYRPLHLHEFISRTNYDPFFKKRFMKYEGEPSFRCKILR